MAPSRVPPLAGWSVVAAFALIGVALGATVWSTRASVLGASEAVERGQALAIEQAVRADLADLDEEPTPDDLAQILAQHHDEGLRYLAMLEGPGQVVAAAGTPVGAAAPAPPPGGARRVEEVGGRLRMNLRAFRRLKAGGRTPRYLVEIEPVQSNALREASTYTLGIGLLAAATLLGVAIVLVRREARRAAEERARERERRLASLGEMSAVLAHEIRNPLASLKGNAQLLAQMIAKALPDADKPRAKAERVVDEAVRLEKLTTDLLHFVRTGAIQRAEVDPGALVREAALGVSPDVVVDTSGAPRAWSLDAARMREVIVNLVDNAVAAGPPVEIAVRAADRRLVIEVADRGRGVPEADRERIFEPFFTAKTQGTGLGLAVARRVTELHGGALTVHTSPHGGALFRAEIPEA